MSRFPPPEYRGPRDRSRSPPIRFPDRRSSAANIFDNRPPPSSRTASDAPRGPRLHPDGPRPPQGNSSAGAAGVSRPAYSSLRDAPPLSSVGGDRGRPFRDREYDRRDRVPSPRERSPPRSFKDTRDYFAPRELDIPRPRRLSRDGPLSAGSTFSEGSSFAPPSFRGGLGRGRGRGDFEFRGGRGGRRNDERELFRRDRSPPRWTGRDLSRDGRDLDRRDDRRFDRRDDDRRPEWTERDREMDRPRRDGPIPRPDPRTPIDSPSSTPAHFPVPTAAPVDPGRLALMEGASVDSTGRKVSGAPNAAQIQNRREVPETPAYLNGRAGTTASRYGQRGSSPPTQAPPVPAFTLSFATPTAAPSTTATHKLESKTLINQKDDSSNDSITTKQEAGIHVPVESNNVPNVSKPVSAEPVVDAPINAPRPSLPHSTDASDGRLQGAHLSESSSHKTEQSVSNVDRPIAATAGQQPVVQPTSPNVKHVFSAPTGPRTSRPNQNGRVNASPIIPSPRLENGAFQGNQSLIRRGHTPPLSAPTGPRQSSFSLSPKMPNNTIPTAPKADRAPPTAPRTHDRNSGAAARSGDRHVSGAPWTSPSLSRHNQWNQWRRPAPMLQTTDKIVPAKRDHMGEERERSVDCKRDPDTTNEVRLKREQSDGSTSARAPADDTAAEGESTRTQNSQASNHSAAQSFFGKPTTTDESGLLDVVDETMSSSEDEDLNPEEDAALFHAKFERQKRALEAQLVDLGAEEYRATTPLESIARLARISLNDLQRLTEHDAMEVDGPRIGSRQPAPAARHTDESEEENADMLTPQGEEDSNSDSRDANGLSEQSRRFRRRSPDIVNLPFLIKDENDFSPTEIFKEDLKRHEISALAVANEVEMELADEQNYRADAEDEFARLYRRWREECEQLDWEAEEQERIERQQSMEPGLETEASSAMLPGGLEGRRALKFNSEYEYQQVLKQSEETARIEQERLERESRRLQADLDKEAIVPDQQTEEEYKRNLFIDCNRFRQPENLTLVFTFKPPADTFTEEEQRLFIAAFRDTPKKWGEIASLLPGRTYKDCIHHYYATKWDSRFRDSRTKKLKAGPRRGRGGKTAPRGRGSALMADLGRTEELPPTMVSDSGRPKRAAAPTTFGEREAPEAKAALGISPAKKATSGTKQDSTGDGEKPTRRRKGAGEKPGRKPKVIQQQQPLAALAAAPTASPEKSPYIPPAQVKEDPARAQNLEDASLLTGFQAGRSAMFIPEAHQTVFSQEGFTHTAPPALDEPTKSKAAIASSSKPGPSSYWSVPEQTDFAKYIAHFGTDFAAIATHMGTKTQTMIKNHYQRQIDGGNKQDLEMAARDADRRRERGEDIGVPPTPTPMIKRKYDNPTPPAPRTLAPHKDVETDDARQPPRGQPSSVKHTSPPQYQAQPRFGAAVQSAPSLVHLDIASPVATSLATNQPLPQHARTTMSTAGSSSTFQLQQQQPQVQPPPSSLSASQSQQQQQQQQQQHINPPRLPFMPEAIRPESRAGAQPATSFRAITDPPSLLSHRSQPTPPIHPNASDPQYINGLVAQQEQAFRLQQEQSQQERFDQSFQRQHAHHSSRQASPAMKPLPNPVDRVPERASERVPLSYADEKISTPPRSSFPPAPAPGLPRPLLSQPIFGQLVSKPFSPAVSNRHPYGASPPRREEPRAMPTSSAPPLIQATAPVSAPSAPEPPKRSNLLSILNADPEEPAPSKRDQDPHRTISPATTGFALPGSSSGPAPRRDMYNQPAMQVNQYSRPTAYPQGRETPVPLSSVAPKPEVNPSQPAKQDWSNRVLAPQPGQPSPSAHDRDMRFWPQNHRTSAYGSLSQSTRANPSPPPTHPVATHSRTASLTAQSIAPTRDPISISQARPHTPLQAMQSIQPSAYGQHSSQAPYQQSSAAPAPPQQPHGHAHGMSIGGVGYSSFHHRAPSRDEPLRSHDQQFNREREREREHERERERADQEWRHRTEEMERQRERERGRDRDIHAQRSHDVERQQQQHSYSRTPVPPALHPPASSTSYAGHTPSQNRVGMGMGMGLREQSFREVEEEKRRHDALIAQQQHREHPDDYRRRPDDSQYQRRTPLGPGGYPQPPQPPMPRR